MKKSLLIFSILLIICVFCGCADKNEVNDLAYVMAIGIDEDDGEIEYTFQFANPISFSGEESNSPKEDEKYESKNPSLKNITVTADSIYTAMNKVNGYFVKKMDLSHIKMFLISDEVSSKNLKLFINGIKGTNDVHPNLYPVIVRGKCKEYLADVATPLEGNPAEYYENIFNTKYTVYSPFITLRDIADKSTFVLPVTEKNDNNNGMAIIKNNKILSYTNSKQTLYYNLLSGNIKSFYYNADDNVSLMVFQSRKPKIKIIPASENTVKITLYLNCNAVWNNTGKHIDYYTVTNKAKENLESELESFMYNISYGENADILCLERKFKMYCLTEDSWNKKNINDILKNCIFNVNVNIDIDNYGTVTKERKVY